MKTYYFSSTSSALLTIIKSDILSSKDNNKTILTSYLLCPEVLELLKDHDCVLKLLTNCSLLSYSEKELITAIKSNDIDVLILPLYFNALNINLKKIYDLCKKHSVLFIIDGAQCIPNRKLINEIIYFSDFICFSPWKHYLLMDGNITLSSTSTLSVNNLARASSVKFISKLFYNKLRRFRLINNSKKTFLQSESVFNKKYLTQRSSWIFEKFFGNFCEDKIEDRYKCLSHLIDRNILKGSNKYEADFNNHGHYLYVMSEENINAILGCKSSGAVIGQFIDMNMQLRYREYWLTPLKGEELVERLSFYANLHVLHLDTIDIDVDYK